MNIHEAICTELFGTFVIITNLCEWAIKLHLLLCRKPVLMLCRSDFKQDTHSISRQYFIMATFIYLEGGSLLENNHCVCFAVNALSFNLLKCNPSFQRFTRHTKQTATE